MTTKVKKQQKSIREQLSELLNFRQIRDSLQQLGLTVGKDKTNSDNNINIKGGIDADELYLSEINRLIPGDISHPGAVFVYDTSKDSDGGAWRERVKHTSWSTEKLNTSTRGSRSKFPAMAVIVAENNRLVIYDADHEDLSMWMVFQTSPQSGKIIDLGYATQELTAVHMLNGVLCVGQRRPDALTDQGIFRINFVSDRSESILGSGASSKHLSVYDGGIGARNSANDYIQMDNRISLISNIGWVRDIDMCVLPGASVDPSTNLPIPTVAIASGVADSGQGWTGNVQGAVDVLRHDGTSVTLWSIGGYKNVVKLFPNGGIMAIGGGGVAYRTWGYRTIPTSDSNSGDFSIGASTDPWQASNTLLRQGNSGNTYIHTGGLVDDPIKQVMSFYETAPTPDNGTTGQRAYMYGYPALHNIAYNDNFEDFGRSGHNIVGERFNTGWMRGNRKISAFCDCTPGTIGNDEDTNLIINGDFSDGLNDWNLRNGQMSAFSVVNGVLNLTGTTSVGYDQLKQTFKTTPGMMYELSMDISYLNNYPFVGLKKSTGEWIQNVQIHTSNGFAAGDLNRFSYNFLADSYETTLILGGNSPHGDGATFDNIKVTESNNHVTNGRSFWTGNAADVIDDWFVGNTGTLTRETDGRLRIDSTSYASAFTHLEGLVQGEQYHVRVQFEGGTDYTDFDVRIKPDSISDSQSAIKGLTTGASVGEMNFSFRATDSQMILQIIPGRGSVLSGTSWVHLAVVTRAVNEYGLVETTSITNAFEIQGKVEKQRVNTNGDLCMYTGYDNSQNLMVLRYPDIDWSNDWSISGWCPTGYGKVSIETADNTTLYNNTVFLMYIHDNMRNTRSRNSGTPNAYPVGSNFFAATYDSVNGKLFVYNHLGVVEREIDDNGNPFLPTDKARVWIGRSTYNGLDQDLRPGTYSMCFLKISQTLLTGAEIRDTHDREYKLIHADAPVSLNHARTYASVSLAVDQHTSELYVSGPESTDVYCDGVQISSKPGATGAGSRDTSNNVNPNIAFSVANGVVARS